MKAVALLLIKGYQAVLSPFLGTQCRFYPSCSSYAYEAVKKYSVFKGTGLAIRRLLRCHPFHEGGIDPVP
jgi:putative membrane protein insertion efficiency factor